MVKVDLKCPYCNKTAISSYSNFYIDEHDLGVSVKSAILEQDEKLYISTECECCEEYIRFVFEFKKTEKDPV